MSTVQSFLSELKQNYDRPKKKQRHNSEKREDRRDSDSVVITNVNKSNQKPNIKIQNKRVDSNKFATENNKRKNRTSKENQFSPFTGENEMKIDKNSPAPNLDIKKRKNKVSKDNREPYGATSADSNNIEHSSTDQIQPLEFITTINKCKLPPHKYILAPMVGASELAFRLLCRKYGAEIAYTPMMNAEQFLNDKLYQERIEYMTTNADHPVVAHFAANDAQQFADAAKEAVYGHYKADAIDLNLGCPQRTAYIGHYGSYLLDTNDRQLICDMIRQAVVAVPNTPIFCKIRLLPTIQETIELIRNIKNAGASLVAIHARYRASWERVGPGARDGPALLEQVQQIRVAVPDITIITNGNTITWDDVTSNLSSTTAHGIMSAEGLLDNPALFLPRYGSRTERDKQIHVWSLVPKINNNKNEEPICNETMDETNDKHSQEMESLVQKRNKLLLKLDALKKIQTKVDTYGNDKISDKEKKKLASKSKYTKKIEKLDKQIQSMTSKKGLQEEQQQRKDTLELKQITVPLGTLYDIADDKVKLALEYIDLATVFPVIIRSVIFHVRRMIKDELVQYQLLEDCIKCTNIDEVRIIVNKVITYQTYPEQFTFDQKKAIAEKDAIEKRTREESKRKDYEARMIRKAKREGLTDLSYYLTVGAAIPTVNEIQQLKLMLRSDVLTIWKQKHSQHCLSYHIDSQKCQRGRSCAFLHIDPISINESSTTTSSSSSGNNNSHSFIESDEVAG